MNKIFPTQCLCALLCCCLFFPCAFMIITSLIRVLPFTWLNLQHLLYSVPIPDYWGAVQLADNSKVYFIMGVNWNFIIASYGAMIGAFGFACCCFCCVLNCVSLVMGYSNCSKNEGVNPLMWLLLFVLFGGAVSSINLYLLAPLIAIVIVGSTLFCCPGTAPCTSGIVSCALGVLCVVSTACNILAVIGIFNVTNFAELSIFVQTSMIDVFPSLIINMASILFVLLVIGNAMVESLVPQQTSAYEEQDDYKDDKAVYYQ